MKRKPRYASQRRNGTEDEIILCTPEGREMLCVGDWDAEWDDDPRKHDADQLKADAELIVTALNKYRPGKPKLPVDLCERLRKAAPELLAVLMEVTPLLDACARNAERPGQREFAALLLTIMSANRAAIAKAAGGTPPPPPKPIVIEVWRGMVQDVLNVPPGYAYEVKDYDSIDPDEEAERRPA